MQSPIYCPTTFYVPESPPHNHKSLQKKKNTIHILFIGKNGSAGKVIRPGFQLVVISVLLPNGTSSIFLLTSYFKNNSLIFDFFSHFYLLKQFFCYNFAYLCGLYAVVYGFHLTPTHDPLRRSKGRLDKWEQYHGRKSMK